MRGEIAGKNPYTSLRLISQVASVLEIVLTMLTLERQKMHATFDFFLQLIIVRQFTFSLHNVLLIALQKPMQAMLPASTPGTSSVASSRKVRRES
jgi:hypothetical protein